MWGDKYIQKDKDNHPTFRHVVASVLGAAVEGQLNAAGDHLVDCPTQLIYILIFLCQRTNIKDIAGLSAGDHPGD